VYPPEPAPEPDSIIYLQNVVVATLAGSGLSGAMDGTADVATFDNPVSVILDPVTAALYVCDFDSGLIRSVEPNGTVSTLVSQRGFTRPFGFGYGADGSLYVDTDADPSGSRSNTSGTLWRLDTATGVASVLAADLGRPRSFAGVSDGRLLLADYQNARVRLLDPSTGVVADLAGQYDCPGMADGVGTAAQFGTPYGVVPLPDGTFVVADFTNHVLRRVTLDGTVSPFAGDGGAGTVDGSLLSARFVGPKALAVDYEGNVYVTDSVAHYLRRVGVDGMVTTIAGNGAAGFQDGNGSDAQFFGMEGLTVTADGTTLFVADGTGGDLVPYNRIREVTIQP
jgi:sugar lactone lactonase YvrE